MNLENIAYYTIQFRKGCDFVPAVSTVNNVVDLVSKVALDIFYLIDQEKHGYVVSFSVIKEIDQKGYIESIFLAIPFLNIYMAYLRYISASDNSSKSIPSKKTKPNPEQEGPPGPPSRREPRRSDSLPMDSKSCIEGNGIACIETRLTKAVQTIIRDMCKDSEGREFLQEIVEIKENDEGFNLLSTFEPKPPKQSKTKKKKSKGLLATVKGWGQKGISALVKFMEITSFAALDEYLNTEEGRAFAKEELAKYEK